jgi:hypothetical protein
MSTTPPKFFNTAGPCVPWDHYMLPALPRLPNVRDLINKKRYFILHAPRQSGKTTAIKAAVDSLNNEGSYYALYCSLEVLRGIEDERDAMSKLVSALSASLRNLNFTFPPLEKKTRQGSPPVALVSRNTVETPFPGSSAFPVQSALNDLSDRLDKELVVFFDEADCLVGQPLLFFLSQLRVGYINRPQAPFPRSIALIGMRNLRDYKTGAGPDAEPIGSSSPFNIAEPFTLSDFTLEEVKTLYVQHTEATGQVFEDEAVQRAWHWSEGQPWLVNALARQVVETILENITARPLPRNTSIGRPRF